jgi:hypothetical protein
MSEHHELMGGELHLYSYISIRESAAVIGRRPPTSRVTIGASAQKRREPRARERNRGGLVS